MIEMVKEVLEGFNEAVRLIFSGDSQVLEITLRAIYVSGIATILSCLWSLPIGVLIGLGSFKGRFILKNIFSSLIGFPTVALGLVLYLILSKSGPLGMFRLLYTPTAIIIGQAILITPIIVSFVASAIQSVDQEIMLLAKTLGASDLEASIVMLKESLKGVILAISASFSRAIAELGVALMLGGNIKGLTRVFTTAIALETAKGEIALSIALTIILLAIVFLVNFVMGMVKR
jgi:tungstate transport system permease protein